MSSKTTEEVIKSWGYNSLAEARKAYAIALEDRRHAMAMMRIHQMFYDEQQNKTTDDIDIDNINPDEIKHTYLFIDNQLSG